MNRKKMRKRIWRAIAAAAIAFSMFTSMAMAGESAGPLKTSADFRDLAGIDEGLKAKIDVMLAKGVFEGVSADTFGIAQHMTRAQFAKVLDLIYGIEVDRNVKGSSFRDVKAEDAANGWAVAYIEAAKKAGLIDGMTDTAFAPGDPVTIGQFAAALVKGLGRTVDMTGSPWYTDGLAQATRLGLLPKGLDGAAAATRGDLVLGAYGGQAAYAELTKPAKVSVTEAKAAGVRKVEVALNQEIADPATAVFSLKKGNTAVPTTAAWAEDKKSAVLTVTTGKLTVGTYTVTLSGIDASSIGTAAAGFTADNEKVARLEFVNQGDRIAKSINAVIRIRALNQYGENTSVTGGYTAYVSGTAAAVRRDEDTGLLEVTVDTSDKRSEVDVIPVTIVLNNTDVTAHKAFKVGMEPYVAAMELGEVQYPADKAALASTGDTAEIAITRYDQYGDKMVWNDAYSEDLKNRMALSGPAIAPFAFEALQWDRGGSTFDTLKVFLANHLDKGGDYRVTFYAGAAAASAVVRMESTEVAGSVAFGDFSDVIAEGDGATYLPFIAYDAQGNPLDAEEIVDNAAQQRFFISVSGADYSSGHHGNDAIVKSGEHQGEIKLDAITAKSGGRVYISLGIFTANIQSNAQTSFNVEDARRPEAIVLDGDKPAPKALPGAQTTVKWIVKDQYGVQLDQAADPYKNYKIKVNVSGLEFADFAGLEVFPNEDGSYTIPAAEFGEQFNGRQFVLTAKAAGTATITAVLADEKDLAVKTVSSALEVISSTNLLYNVSSVPDLFAALDHDDTPASDKLTAPPEDGEWAVNSRFARQLEVTAKDRSGSFVAIPGSRIVSATTSNPSAAKVIVYDHDAWVLGNKAGEAQLIVVYNKPDGTAQAQTLNLHVKSDPVEAVSISADAENSHIVSANGIQAYTLLPQLKVTDNYGTEYTERDLGKYFAFLGVQYVVSDVKAGGSVTLNSDGTVDILPGTTEFTIKAITNNDKSTSTLVTVRH